MTAAIQGAPLPGMIVFVKEIKPAVEQVRFKTEDLERNGVTSNVQYRATKLAKSSTMLGGLIKQEKLKIVGSRYDLAMSRD